MKKKMWILCKSGRGGGGVNPLSATIFFYKIKVLNVQKRKNMCIVEGIRFSWIFLIIVSFVYTF